MLTVRLDDRLDSLTRKAAALEGATVSEFMRRAIAERAQQTLAENARVRLGDVIGAIHGSGAGRARESGMAFGDLLAKRASASDRRP